MAIPVAPLISTGPVGASAEPDDEEPTVTVDDSDAVDCWVGGTKGEVTEVPEDAEGGGGAVDDEEEEDGTTTGAAVEEDGDEVA